MADNDYNGITDAELATGKPLRSSLMKRFKDNPLAAIQGDQEAIDDGKGVYIDRNSQTGVMTDEQNTNLVLRPNGIIKSDGSYGVEFASDASSGSVNQAALDTSIGEVTASSNASPLDLVLPGGEYGFYPQIKITPNSGGATQGLYMATMGGKTTDPAFNGSDDFIPSTGTTTYTTRIALSGWDNNLTPDSSTEAQQRFINASPPFDLGDGDIAHFVFILMRDGKVAGSYSANVPPWGYNGPTSLRPDYICCKTGKKYINKHIDKPCFSDVKDGNLSFDDYVQACSECKVERVEITQEIKNADMSLIPQPFGLKKGDSVLLLDGQDSYALSVLHNQGESLGSLVHKGYIELSNSSLTRKSPKDVKQVSWSWKKS